LNSALVGSRLAGVKTVMPLKPPGTDAALVLSRQRSIPVTLAVMPRVLIALSTDAQNDGLPMMWYRSGFLACAAWICGVASATPGAMPTTFAVAPALPNRSGASCFAGSMAAGTSMTITAALFRPFFLAKIAGPPNALSGFDSVKSILLPRKPGLWLRMSIIGMPAAFSGLMTGSVWPSEPLATAMTFAATNWLPQSVVGDALVSQWTSSIGWPPMPPRCSFAYLTTASAAFASLDVSMAAETPSLTDPILTGVPLAFFSGPSAALLSEDELGLAFGELLPEHAVSASAEAARTAPKTTRRPPVVTCIKMSLLVQWVWTCGSFGSFGLS
jgi:hypothetical protein